MSLNKSIIDIRVELQSKKLSKSGQNKFAGFSYFELSDFLPTLNELMQKHEVNDQFSISDGYARLLLVKDTEANEYTIPFVMFDVPLNKNGQPSMQHIQYLGALNTYYKRYLYLNAFGITDGDVIDAIDNTEVVHRPTASKATPEDKQRMWDEFRDFCGRYEVDAMEFIGSQVDTANKNAVHNTVNKWLKNPQSFIDQLLIFKNAD